MTDREKLTDIIDVHKKYGSRTEHLVDELISNGVTFQRWIPVTERLPEECGCYLVTVKYKYDFEKEYTYDTDVAAFYHGFDCDYIDGQWNTYIDWDEGQQYIHVTHWMPLPEPPKEKENV